MLQKQPQDPRKVAGASLGLVNTKRTNDWLQTTSLEATVVVSPETILSSPPLPQPSHTIQGQAAVTGDELVLCLAECRRINL